MRTDTKLKTWGFKWCFRRLLKAQGGLNAPRLRRVRCGALVHELRSKKLGAMRTVYLAPKSYHEACRQCKRAVFWSYIDWPHMCKHCGWDLLKASRPIAWDDSDDIPF